MPVTVVVGGQFGGEGKGKVTAHLCRKYVFDIAVRCGGPNSGHTVTIDSKQIVLRQIPAGVVNPHTRLLLAPGCLIDVDVLLGEIELFSLTPERLGIDQHAVIVDKEHGEEEKRSGFGKRIGSTCTGTGIAVARRILRAGDVKLAKDMPELRPYLANVSSEVMASHLDGERVVIEGTQGFGLSVYHSPYYPYATSRDTTASSFLSEVGTSPLVVSDIVMVIRTFPIRVGGNSGPLPNEIGWEILRRESGYPYEIQEYTTVTKRLRRVARFDLDIVKEAANVNMPTYIALMGLDYLDYRNKNVEDFHELTQHTNEFILWLERELGRGIALVGTGPTDHEIIDRLREKRGDEQARQRKEKIRAIPAIS